MALAFALAFDAFAVAVGIQLGRLDRWTAFRISFHFGFAQFGMPIIGWMAGDYIFSLVGSGATWLAAVVLAGIGGRLIWEQFNPDERKWKGDPTRGASLLLLMFATSIDALAAGLSLGLTGVHILYPAMLIGGVCALMSLTGLFSGRALGLKFSRGAAIFGGFILLLLAIRTALG